MAKTKYDHVYIQLRDGIENGTYPYQDLLASEHILIKELDCSRNTVRRVTGRLAGKEYVQSIHGGGVQVIYQPQEQSEFFLSNIENMKEAVAKNKKSHITQAVCFAELTVNGRIQVRITFPLDGQIHYIQRVRYIDGEASIIDHNYFLKCVAKSLTPEIAQKPIYEYMGQELGESIIAAKERTTMERMNQIDEKYLDMKGYSCMAVVSSMIYNAQDIMFEFTRSHHRPD